MAYDISFAKEVKAEICNANFDLDRKKAVLAGFIRIAGTIGIKKGQTELTLTTTSNQITKYFYSFIKENYTDKLEIMYEKQLNLDKKIIYSLVVRDCIDTIFEDLEIDLLSDDIAQKYFKDDNLYGGYLAGSFLASGSINSPYSTNYHLEISGQYEPYINNLRKMFIKAGHLYFSPAVCKRRNKYLVYLKKSDQVSNFLIVIGAVDSCMKFENIRVDRDFSNSSHRLEMCDMANMKKTIYAAQEQIMMIEAIGLSAIKNEKANIVASTRLLNPEATLSELSDIIFEEHNLDISKSNINHIFRSIRKKYEETI